mmetsp:Transcript_28742/g.61287  ORF Transcript_28742/g.61287 Transcript_28742/m.61287 type:complete len:130 (-) Transcript_28742:320-709(-)
MALSKLYTPQKRTGAPTNEREAKCFNEIEKPLDIDPANIPAERKFLLEMDFDGLYRSSFEKQSYWVVAMKAAYTRAEQRKASVRRRQRASTRRRSAKQCRIRPTLDNGAMMQQIREDQGLSPPTTRRIQ